MRLRFTLYPYNLPAICFSQWPFALSHRPVSFSSRLRTYMAIVSVYPERCADDPLSFTHIGATALKRGGVYHWELIA